MFLRAKTCVRWFVVVGGICSAFLLGCSNRERLYPATGRVTYQDGTPLAGGAIEFRPAKPSAKPGPNATGQIASDGTFQMSTFGVDDGVVIGQHQVLIIPPPTPEEFGGRRLSNSVAPRFGSFETSGLHADVVPQGPNYFEFKVSSR